MKTLNRTLSLTLVFALVFSLMSFAFAATTTTATTTAATKLSDFTDKDQLTYTEAADYLIAAGVVKGDTDTTLNPKGDLTREQAAKLIAYACLGQVAADNLKASVAPFNDVAADRWSAGYIAYCQKQGIINGYGDGNFGPADKVTGYQFGKMLLCSIGYGVNGEFTGAGWELEVAKLALAYGIFDGNTTGANSNAANREEAFLYTFNTLSKLCAVSYNKALGVYYVPGRDALTTNPMSATITLASNLDTRADTVGAVKFDMTRQATTNGAYNEARHVWQKNGTNVTGKYADGDVKVLAKSFDGTHFVNLTNNAKSTYIGYDADDAATTEYYYNGTKLSSCFGAGTANTVTINGTAYVTLATAIAAAQNEASVKGVTVSFIDTDKDGSYNTVSVVRETITKAGTVSVKTTGNVKTVSIAGIVPTTNAANVTGYEGIEKDDYVAWHRDGTDYVLTKCEAKTGTVMGYNAAGNIVNFNGANVGMTNLGGADTATTVSNNNLVGVANVTAYFDANGYIVKVIAPTDYVTNGNLVFVKDLKDSGAYTVNAQAVFADGSNATIPVAKLDNVTFTGDKTTDEAALAADSASAATTYATAAGIFYTFTKNATTGVYTLKTPDASFGTTVPVALPTTILDTTKAQFAAAANGLATSSTTFVYAKATGGYNVYTGISNAPSYNLDTTTGGALEGTAAVFKDNNGYAKFVVAYGGAAGFSNSDDYMFVVVPESKVYYPNPDEPTATYYGSVLNGVVKDVPAVVDCNGAGGLQAGTLYRITGYDAGKVATVAANAPGDLIFDPATTNLASNFSAQDSTLSATASAALTGGAAVTNNYVLNKDCKIYLYDTRTATPTIAESTIDEIAGLEAGIYQVQARMKSTNDASIVELYVTIVANTSVSAATAAKTADGTGSITGTITPTGVGTGTIAFAGAAASTGYTVTLTVPAGAKVYTGATAATTTTLASNVITMTSGGSSSTVTTFVRVSNGAMNTVYTVTITAT